MKLSELIKYTGDKDITPDLINKLNILIYKENFPKLDEMFYYITTTGWKAEIYHGAYEQDMILSKNKVFKTEDEIKTYIKIQKQLDDYGFTPDWEDITQAKFYLIYNAENKQINIKCTYVEDVAAAGYFGTKEAAEMFLRMNLKEDLLNYVFNRYFNEN